MSWSLLVPDRSARPRYEIEVKGVHEVFLLGRVDAAWAASILGPEGLEPALRDGAAEAMLGATTLRWAGVTFSESLFLVRTGGGAWFLVGALNTIGFFAWVERARNASPYRRGRVEERADDRGVTLVAGEVGEGIRAHRSQPLPGPLLPERYEGPVELPGGKRFLVLLEGDAMSAPFGGDDTFTLAPPGVDPWADRLRAAGFVPESWRVKAAATHAKSATIRRG